VSDTDSLTHAEQEAAVYRGLRQFSNLPAWLASIRDHDRTYRVLSRDIPEIAEGRISLKKCKIGHLQYRDGSWPIDAP
jgi:hypothetical protein